jgi:hypothetical protein
VGLVAGLGIGGVGYSVTQRPPAQTPPRAVPTLVVAPPQDAAPAPVAPAPAHAAHEAPDPQKGRQVLLHSPVPGAVAYIPGADPVLLPTNVEVPEGETVEVEVAARGYYRKRAMLDGNQDRVTVVLTAVHGSSRPKDDPYDNLPAPPAAPKKSRPSADVIVEPWE